MNKTIPESLLTEIKSVLSRSEHQLFQSYQVGNRLQFDLLNDVRALQGKLKELESTKRKVKIYCYNNGGYFGVSSWNLECVAMGEDGAHVASHICSSELHMKHDIGITSTRHHDQYNAQYGEGNWELEWVPTPSWEEHKGVQDAIALYEQSKRNQCKH